MKKLLKKQALVVKTSKYGSALVDLSNGSREDYKGNLASGTLLFRKNKLSKAVEAGLETNLHSLTKLHARLQPAITKREEAAATQLANGVLRDAYAKDRVDLRSLVTFTIDSEKSKDLDDAISAYRENDGFRVFIHIADVSAALKKTSLIERRARKRLTSFYWPDGSLPMLPRALSEACFSLLPGQDRLALTVEMFIAEGKVVDRKVYASTINSNMRMSYIEVDAYLAGLSEAPEEVKDALFAARDAVDLALDFTEVSRELTYEIVEGQVLHYSHNVLGPSNKLVEKLMVLANVQMGLYLQENNYKAIYRAHNLKDEEKVADALKRVQTLFELPPNCDFAQAWDLIENSSHAKKDVLLRLLLHTTPPAQYQIIPAPHEGLGEQVYIHFTSPIRRYADLINHRIIHAVIEGKRNPYFGFSLKRLSKNINGKTLEAKRMSRLMDDLFLSSNLAYEKEKGNFRKPVKVKIENFTHTGAFCSFAHEKNGFLYLDQLGPGELNEERTIFTGKYRTVVIGDELTVMVGRPDQARGRLSLKLYRERKPRSDNRNKSRAKV